MARARPIPGLEAETRFSAAAAATVDVRTREVFAHADGVLDTGAIERVHDMRVATRRLRAALEIFAPCFPPKRHKRLLREVKRLADVLGERRDPDVAIERLRTLGGKVPDDAAAIEALIAELGEAQQLGNDRLAAALDEVRESELEQRLLELAQAARP